MPAISITITADQAAKLQLATYIVYPDLFPIDSAVILNRTTNAVLLASDGTGINAKSLTDVQVNSLINNGKPSNDIAVQTSMRRFWRDVLDTAAGQRRDYLRQQQVETISDPME